MRSKIAPHDEMPKIRQGIDKGVLTNAQMEHLLRINGYGDVKLRDKDEPEPMSPSVFIAIVCLALAIAIILMR